MKYLVTGASGFIGRYLVYYLLKSKHEVVIFNRKLGDIRDIKTLEPYVAGVDGVFHLAAHIGKGRSDLFSSVNVLGTQNILSLAKKYGIQRVVFASTSGVYGNNNHYPLTEDADVFPVSDYARSKLYGEFLGKYSGINFVALRCFNVWGSGTCLVSRFLYALKNNQVITLTGDGQQTRDFVHVFDVVHCMLKAMDLAPKGFHVYNCCSSVELSIRELAEILGEKIGVRPRFAFLSRGKNEIERSWGSALKAKNNLDWEARFLLKPAYDFAGNNA